MFLTGTPGKINMEPEDWRLEDHFPLQTSGFQGSMLINLPRIHHGTAQRCDEIG